MRSKSRTPLDEALESPTTWFATLEMARERGDYQLAERAQAKLRTLGVTVRFNRPGNRRGARHD